MTEGTIVFAVNDFAAIAQRMTEIATDEESDRSIIAQRDRQIVLVVSDPVHERQ